MENKTKGTATPTNVAKRGVSKYANRVKAGKSAINPNAKLSLNDAALDKVFEKLPNQLQHIISICSSYGGTATIEQINTAWVDERMNANEKYTQDVFTVLAHYKNAGLKRLDNKTIFQLELINLN
jgi:hypothetical protein|tara:strand:- start:69 stop:443 length:375 start_codon:yes stop_codon:yes gene_type:complete